MFLAWLSMFFVVTVSAAHVHYLGFLIDGDPSESLQDVIEYTVHLLNANSSNGRFQPVFLPIQDKENSFEVSQKVCDLLHENSILALFNTQPDIVDGYIKSVTHHLKIPYIKVHRDENSDAADLTLNFFPDIHQAVVKLVTYYKWETLVLVYSGNQGEYNLLLANVWFNVRNLELLEGKEVVDLAASMEDQELTIKLAEISNTADIQDLFIMCKQENLSNVFVDASVVPMQDFLNIALMRGMINTEYSFIFGNMDLKQLDLTIFQYNDVHITGFSLQRDDDLNEAALADMAFYSLKTGVALFGRDNIMKVCREYLKSTSVQTASLLVYDAIHAVVKSVSIASSHHSMQAETLSCSGNDTLGVGLALHEGITSTEIAGLSGNVSFAGGQRKDYTLSVLQLFEGDGLVKIASFASLENKIYMGSVSTDKVRGISDNVLIITAILEEPYLMKHQNYLNKQGNDRYVGFCADLIEMIAERVGFAYEIIICENCTYGTPDENGEWDGMVRQLMDKRADLALGSFTINYKREQVIDMTKPFMQLGISILYKVPKKERPGLFSFMAPLAVETWFYVLLACVSVSFIMYTLGRFSPYEQYTRTMTTAELEGEEDIDQSYQVYKLSLVDSFWFSVGTLMQQDSDVSPSATSTRTFGGIWWLFSLVVVSSYTANLAAFLTVERMITPIENADELSMQTEIEYGVQANGSTWLFFKESNIETYKRMWDYMSRNPHVFMDNVEEGVQRVKEGGYAFLMESVSLDYRVKRDCDLMQIGGLLDSKGYGIGTQQFSPWRDEISMTILTLQENGHVYELYEKWWNNGGMCDKSHKKETVAHSLKMSNVGGIFIILVSGIVLAIIVAVTENIYFKKKHRLKKIVDQQSDDDDDEDQSKLAYQSSYRQCLKSEKTLCASSDSNFEQLDKLPRLSSGIYPPLSSRTSWASESALQRDVSRNGFKILNTTVAESNEDAITNSCLTQTSKNILKTSSSADNVKLAGRIMRKSS